MKLFLATILTALLCFIAGLFLPWWSIAIVAFLVALLIPQTLPAHFLSGFLGVFILWVLIALWIDIKNEHILSVRIAQLFHLGASSFLLILVMGIIGGLTGGFAALSGGSVAGKRRRHR